MNYLKQKLTESWRSVISFFVALLAAVGTVLFASWLYDAEIVLRTKFVLTVLWSFGATGVVWMFISWSIDREVAAESARFREELDRKYPRRNW